MLQKLPPDSKTCVILFMERTLKDLTASLIKGIRISILVHSEDLEAGSCPERSHHFSKNVYKTGIMHSLVHMVANEIETNTALFKDQISEPANSNFLQVLGTARSDIVMVVNKIFYTTSRRKS